MNMEDRGARLKRLRMEKSLSPYDLSKYLEISQEDVKNLENNEGKLNLTILTKLSNLYCCNSLVKNISLGINLLLILAFGVLGITCVFINVSKSSYT